MIETWVHVGRLWTNGEPFLAVDAGLRGAWLGFSEDQYEEIIGLEESTVAVGDGRAAVVGADGVVRDDSWVEVFLGEDGAIAVVQAAGVDYRRAVEVALRHPGADDEDGGVIDVPSGELAVFSSALDGAGEHSAPLVAPRPGPVPADHGPPSRVADPGLLIPAAGKRYSVRVRWFTTVDDDTCFARWLLIP